MTTNRYYKKEYDEEYYILDSKVISEKEFDEKLEYEDYKAFEDSLTSDEIIDLLNENDKLKKEVQSQGKVIDVLNELNNMD